MEQADLSRYWKSSPKLLIGLGEEWKLPKKTENHQEQAAQKRQLCRAYEILYELIKDKDYFIITMATDGMIYDTPLGSRQETVISERCQEKGLSSCEGISEEMIKRMDRVFPKRQEKPDTRWERIVAPCGNETWRQCERACTKDIWEPGEIPDDICPHCHAPLVGNTIEAPIYIEEGYLPQWNRYTRWLAETLNQETLILELGTGFDNPGVIRFPFEKAVFFNQKAHMWRVNEKFSQIPQELKGRAEGIKKNSVSWIMGRS